MLYFLFKEISMLMWNEVLLTWLGLTFFFYWNKIRLVSCLALLRVQINVRVRKQFFFLLLMNRNALFANNRAKLYCSTNTPFNWSRVTQKLRIVLAFCKLLSKPIIAACNQKGTALHFPKMSPVV
jgi:hypothetical protein